MSIFTWKSNLSINWLFVCLKDSERCWEQSRLLCVFKRFYFSPVALENLRNELRSDPVSALATQCTRTAREVRAVSALT